MTGRTSEPIADALPLLAAAVNEGIERGLHRGVQVSVSLQGAVVADGAVGASHDDVPLTASTLVPWRSAGKPLTAFCLLMLHQRGRIELETPVSDVIPEFHQTSQRVTLLHLLTHTAGLASVATGSPHLPWEEIISRICAAGLQDDWVPGERAAYDPVRSWFLLGELVRRIDGRPIEQFVRNEVLLPSGMTDSWLALPAGMTEEYGDRIGRTWTVKRGGDLELTKAHLPAYCESPSPGASFRGPMRELRLFYEMLLAGGLTADGRRLVASETVDLMTTRHREGMYDETFGHTVDFGLGVIVNSLRYGVDTVPYGYGALASDGTFGHGGALTCTAFADPGNQLLFWKVAEQTEGSG